MGGKMKIRSKFKEYQVVFENDLEFISELMTQENSQFVVDRKIYHLYSDFFVNVTPERIFLIDAEEDNKTIETALKICEVMTEIPAKRNAHLISFGGGITQDITGFVANVLYRGIRWTFVPTTLLAACDSCIGGKTSLNYKKYKNLLGTFYPPDDIYICPKFFQTLSQKDFESGMGEVIKFNIMAGEQGLDTIEKNINKLLLRDETEIRKCVEKSLEFKKCFIEKDEFDRGERIKLNFAHTFGHAIETTTRYEIPHGTAVAIGMIMANSISLKRGFLDEEFVTRCKEILLKVIHVGDAFEKISVKEFIDAMRKDKKQVDSRLTVVLLKENGNSLDIVHDVSEEEVKASLEKFQASYFG